MNREYIIRMAREVGLPHWYETEGIVNEALLIKFAALVASAEREACAKVCEEQAKEYASMAAWKLCNECANAIRARGQA